jgi:hypothetical protein
MTISRAGPYMRTEPTCMSSLLKMKVYLQQQQQQQQKISINRDKCIAAATTAVTNFLTAAAAAAISRNMCACTNFRHNTA